MMWNSRVSAVALAGGIAAATLAAGAVRASDAPAPGLRQVAPPVVQTRLVRASERLVIKSVSMRTLRRDNPVLFKLFSSAEREALTTPALISVQVAGGFGNLASDASPVIVLNGKPLPRSYVPHGVKDRVEAVVKDARALREGATVQVGWIGALETTVSAPARANLD
jgi:hypothetical protein